MPLPETNVAGDPDHALHHNDIHTHVGLGLPTELGPHSSGHVGHHETIHSVWTFLDLPTVLNVGDPDHLLAHDIIHAYVNGLAAWPSYSNAYAGG